MCNKRVITRYFLFYLAAGFFFIVYNYLLDIVFFTVDYGNRIGVVNGLAYLGYFLVLYSPFMLPFLIFYNYCIEELTVKRNRLVRYGMAAVIGMFMGLMVGRNGISFYIGSYRTLKSTLLFGLIMVSLEVARDMGCYLKRNRKTTDQM